MTNEQILKKAIKKCGWWYEPNLEAVFNDNVLIAEYNTRKKRAYYHFIFSHDFAKAFFGKKLRPELWDEESGGFYQQPEWEYRLQQMVIERDPIKYLKKFL